MTDIAEVARKVFAQSQAMIDAKVAAAIAVERERCRQEFSARIMDEREQAVAAERERIARVVLEQRCVRETPWDLACVAIAAAIRKGE